MKKNKKTVLNNVGRLAVSAMVLSNLTLQSALAGNSETPSSAQTMFRNAFSAAMPQGTTSAQQADLLYPIAPASKMINLDMKSSENVYSYFDRLRNLIPNPEAFSEASNTDKPSALSQAQLDTELNKLASNGDDLPLYIFAPGIFGEFIKDHPFQDVLEDNKANPSPYAKQFKELLASSSSDAKYKTDLRLENAKVKYLDYKKAIDPIIESATKSAESLYANSNNKEAQVKAAVAKAVQESLRNNPEVRKVGRTERPLDELIMIGVIKDSSGKVVANTLTLDTKELSLESLGALRNNSKMFIRRISKFFNLLGKVPSNIILEGYSRGTPIALDMLALGFEKSCSSISDKNSDTYLEHGCLETGKNWTNNIHGFLGVAGVLYGSELADVGFKVPVTKTPNKSETANIDDQDMAKQLAAVNEILDFAAGVQYTPMRLEYGKLTEVKKNYAIAIENAKIDLQIAKTTVVNTYKWLKFVKAMAEIQKHTFVQTAKEALAEVESLIKDQETNPVVIYAKLKKAIVKVEQGVKGFQKDLAAKGKMDIRASIATALLYLKEGFGELKYNDNIRQFRSLLEETLAAAEDLSSQSRYTWWQNSVIPTQNIKYYTVSATMNKGDFGLNGTPLSQQNSISYYSYNTVTPDFGGLLASYQKFIDLGNFMNNDSQVSLHKSSFHPQIATLMNPKQKTFVAESLGLFHTHHWGLTLKTVTQLDEKRVDTKNEPFPRVAILKGVLAATANDPEYSIAERTESNK